MHWEFMYGFGLQIFLFNKKWVVAMEVATTKTWGLGYHEEAGHFYKQINT